MQKLLKEKFIPIACNDWYQRRRQDAEGGFFRKMSDQTPRGPRGNATRQGHYVFTASGKLLGFNNNRSLERRMKMVTEALTKWEQLKPDEKAAEVRKGGRQDSKYQRIRPDGSSVIKVYTRVLEKSNGKLKALKQEQVGSQPAIDHLWLRQEEVAAIHKILKEGGGELPKRLAYRMVRYHVLDNTRGEPPMWKPQELEKVVVKISKGGDITAELAMKTSDSQRGFEGHGKGTVKFDAKGKLQQFDLTIVGNHWGEGRYTRGARPGKTPIGFVFILTNSKAPKDNIPPQGMHWEQGYWQAEK